MLGFPVTHLGFVDPFRLPGKVRAVLLTPLLTAMGRWRVLRLNCARRIPDHLRTSSWVWCHKLEMPESRSLRQDFQLKSSLSYIVVEGLSA